VADEKIINRVRKLLAQAEGTDNEHEAATFMAAAMATMERHALDEALVRAGAGEAPPEITTWQWVVQGHSDHNLAWATAAWNVAHALGCEGVMTRSSGDDYAQLFGIKNQNETLTLHLFGTASAIEHSQLLIASLSLQWEAAAKKAAQERYPEPVVGYGYQSPLSGGSSDSYESLVRSMLGGSNAGLTWRDMVMGSPYTYQRQESQSSLSEQRTRFMNSYVVGYSQRVHERLKGTREEIQEQVAGAALVRLSDEERTRAAVNAAFPLAGKGESLNHDLQGYHHGMAAGGSADLGGSNLGGQQGRELEA